MLSSAGAGAGVERVEGAVAGGSFLITQAICCAHWTQAVAILAPWTRPFPLSINLCVFIKLDVSARAHAGSRAEGCERKLCEIYVAEGQQSDKGEGEGRGFDQTVRQG